MVYFFGFLGGLALFLYGMQLMGDGLQRCLLYTSDAADE